MSRERLPLVDTVRVGTAGLRARPVRAALSVVGIAIGIATVVVVVVIPSSAKAELLGQLARSGNLLTVESGQTLGGTPAPLPASALGMIGRIPPVERASAVGVIPGASVRRSAAIPAVDTGGISVAATDVSLPSTLDGTMLHGAFLNRATERYPAVVLGYAAAEALGIPDLSLPAQVFIAQHYFTVVGILAPVALSPDIDESALIGFPAAAALLGRGADTTQIYLRALPDQVVAVQRVLAATANPDSPEAVNVSRPSDLLAARAAAEGSFNGLLLALGGVALLVGGIGIANVMIISVLERRAEIGLRRSLGATRGQVATQFFAESLLLAGGGALVGVVLGIWGAAVDAHVEDRATAVPLAPVAAALAAGVIIGAVAGVYPAVRAARLAPVEALRAG